MAKRDQTNLNRYGILNPQSLEQFKNKKQDTCLQKYGVRNVIASKQVQQKRNCHIQQIVDKTYKTKKQNNSFGKSKTEDVIYKMLCEQFGINNVQRQYKSELYPYPCDFYVISLDLYIEYQGWWSHGKQAFNKDNKKHQQILQQWKQRSQDETKIKKQRELYKSAIKTWTIKDPQKRQTAKENNLSWIEFFTFKEFENWFNRRKENK